MLTRNLRDYGASRGSANEDSEDDAESIEQTYAGRFISARNSTAELQGYDDDEPDFQASWSEEDEEY